ncbi:hypothetical protein TSAR_005478 [Trichomalopsis sarcophagae]|uniref:Uncharacterized protein n=1 Tax=Trichomalopsis sarcophagae TaxID=543379 RepID=A0A232FER4_9HYME|nr:hypothetical protein TSAR_005478 [Trichomalopsis sarcophagae]
MISTPTNILIAESKMQFIQERTKFLCKNNLYKIYTNEKILVHNTINYFNKLLKNKNKNRKFRTSLLRNCIENNVLINNININVELGKQLQTINSISVGSACICDNLNQSVTYSINKLASIFTAESIAIRSAIDIALQHTDRNAFVFTDSLKSVKNTFDIIKNEGQKKGITYFNNFFNYRSKPWFANKNQIRELIVILNRCRSGHHSLASSLSRIGLKENPQCQCGFENQDVNHILYQCHLFNKERQVFTDELRKQNIFLPNTYTSLLSNPSAKICKILYSFFKTCEILI